MSSERTSVVIIGAGGFGREVLWLLRCMGPEVEPVGFLDNSQELWGQVVCGLPVLGPIDRSSVADRGVHYVWGAGLSRARHQLRRQLGEVRFLVARHPAALLSEYVRIGDGSVICAGTVVTTQVDVGQHVLLNLNVTVGHDAVIGDYCSLSPGVHVSGRVRLGEGVSVGTGAVILPGVSIGAWSEIGAGAVVTKDLPDHVVAVGVPARVTRAVEGPRPDVPS
ncbi:MAG: acetyltransferase [Armatimonadota bacterium]|nr:MAG: acetyltransferase [Armatimonadota bacterium]